MISIKVDLGEKIYYVDWEEYKSHKVYYDKLILKSNKENNK